MKYLDYNKCYNEYAQAKDDLNEILNEYIFVFQKTQPKIKYGDRVQSSNQINRTEEYVIEVERRRLYQRMKDAEDILDAKRKILELQEEELRRSKNIYDLIYTAKWVDGLKVKAIMTKLDLMGLCYSRSQIYAIIHNIKVQVDRDF